MATMLPTRTIGRLVATRGSLRAGGVSRPVQIRTSSCPSHQHNSLLHRHKNTIGAKSGLFASLAYSALYSTASLVLCESNKDDNNSDEDFISKIKSKLDSQSLSDLSQNDTLNSIASALGSQISLAISSGIPTDLSYGFFAGYFSGLALKKIGKIASITLGASFLALQTLAFHGYIDVHHEKLQQQVEGLLDRNGDGVVDSEDLKSALKEVQKVAGFGIVEDGNMNLIASGGGFGMGFLGGLRSG